MTVYTLDEGDGPLIVSVPHAGTRVPGEIQSRFTEAALSLPDTDWHVDKLYEDFTKEYDSTLIKAHYSRYVIDLNRPPDNAALYPGQAKLSLCPEKTFDGADIYKSGEGPDDYEIARRRQQYWQPYHDALEDQIERVVERHGYAVLYDAHSIRQCVPRLFKGALPDLNLGTANGKSCGEAVSKAAFAAARKSQYSAVLNGRFIGGYITRHYGDPAHDIHAIQMELACPNYMDEESLAYDKSKAGTLKKVLYRILHAIADNAGAGIEAKPV